MLYVPTGVQSQSLVLYMWPLPYRGRKKCTSLFVFSAALHSLRSSSPWEHLILQMVAVSLGRACVFEKIIKRNKIEAEKVY